MRNDGEWAGALRSFALLRALATKSEEQFFWNQAFPHSFSKTGGCRGTLPELGLHHAP
jgi:hypothetical protein